MTNAQPNGNASAPPPRDVAREAKRLARLQHLRLVASQTRVDDERSISGPKDAA
jgi:hypothetical protein